MRHEQLSQRRIIQSTFTRYLVTCSLAAGLICAITILESASAAGEKKENPATQTQQTQQATKDSKTENTQRLSESEQPVKQGNRALIGREIRSNNSEVIGEIENVVSNNIGEIQYVIVSFDGFWGIGSDEAMVPIDKLNLTKNRNYVFFKGTEEELVMFPDYSEYGWAGRRYGSRPNAWFNKEPELYDGQPRVSGVYGNPEDREKQNAANSENRTENRDVQAYSSTSGDMRRDMREKHRAMKDKNGDYAKGRYNNERSYQRSSRNSMLSINWDEFGNSGVKASNLIDREVQNSKGEKLGTVEDVIIGRDGRVRLVLDVGATTGQKNKRVQADLSDIQVKSEVEYIVYDVSKDELKKEPNFKDDFKTASMKRDTEKGDQQQMNGAAGKGKENTNANTKQ